MNLDRLNPELRRNLWLDATPRRLALAGAILAGVFAAVWLVDRGRHAFALTAAGGAVFAAAALVWAPLKVRRAVTDEARAATWDFQRLGALDPFTLAWGKLAGATARPWAFAAGGLLIALLQLASTTNLRHTLFWLLAALGLAVAAQTIGLASGLLDVRRTRASGRGLSARAPGLVFAILALLALAGVVWVEVRAAREAARLAAGSGVDVEVAGPVVRWAGRTFTALRFSALSLIALAALTSTLAWRLMRLELRHAARPLVFPAALGLVWLYAFGFDPAPGAVDGIAARLGAAGLAAGALAWLCAFAEPADRVLARRLGSALAAGRIAETAIAAPPFAWAALLAGATAALLAILRLHDDDGAGAILALAAVALLLRDLGIIAWRRFSGGGDRMALAPLAAIYVVAAPIGLLAPHARVLALLVPSPDHPRAALVALGLEAAIAWLFAASAIARPVARPWRPWDDPEEDEDEDEEDENKDRDAIAEAGAPSTARRTGDLFPPPVIPVFPAKAGTQVRNLS